MTDTTQKPIFEIDITQYQHLLDESDATDEEKQEFLQTLWNLIVEIIQCGYHIHPVQQAMDAQGCGQADKKDCTTQNSDSPVLESIEPTFNTHNTYEEA